MLKSVYYYIDKFNKDEIDKLDRFVSIIFRNYSNKINEKEIKDLTNFCRKQRRKVYISNNLRIALKGTDVDKPLNLAKSFTVE